MTFTRCTIGVSGEPGWLVRYGGNLIATLQADEDGSVALVGAFEHPFHSTWLSWKSFDAAKARFCELASLYRAGVPPIVITRVLEDAERLQHRPS